MNEASREEIHAVIDVRRAIIGGASLATGVAAIMLTIVGAVLLEACRTHHELIDVMLGPLHWLFFVPGMLAAALVLVTGVDVYRYQPTPMQKIAWGLVVVGLFFIGCTIYWIVQLARISSRPRAGATSEPTVP